MMVKKKQIEKKHYTTTRLVLSDGELRDIINNLKNGKPLNDKYRFLLFEDKKQLELVWNGKTGEVTNVVLPFQTIEQIDEPRKIGSEEEKQTSLIDFGIDARGRQLSGWMNKLIWGDNKLILSSLKNGPLREEIEKQGGIKLIYIDPPFDVGADFSMNINIGNDEFTKQPNVLEELAYRDTWGKGSDSFLSMIYERLVLMKDLLSVDGSIFVHCDWRLNSSLRLIMDEIFGVNFFQNEIIWVYKEREISRKRYNRKHDSILFYSKSDNFQFYCDSIREKYSPVTLKKFKFEDEKGKFRIRHKDGRSDIPIEDESENTYRQYLESNQGPLPRDWFEMPFLNQASSERLDYPTQKPESFLKRIIMASSKEGDLVADFFVGSGTTAAIAEKLDRKWICADLGKFSIHTSRKRLIEVQRQLKKDGKDFRAFEILNLGKYERQHYVGVNQNLRDDEKQKQLEQKEQEFVKLILYAYKANVVQGFKTFHGRKSNRMVVVGPIDLPVGRLFVEECIDEAIKNKITKVDILAFEFEMGLYPHIQEEAKKRGVILLLKKIPREVFDKRAVEKNQVVFTDVSYIEVITHYDGNKVAVELTDFSVFYNQDSITNAETDLRPNSHKIVIESGNIIKITKDKTGIVKRNILTKKWTDWIDYWAVDFNFEDKKEIIKVEKPKKQTGKLDFSIEYEEKWTGDYIFENEWQTFRTQKNPIFELQTPYRTIKGKQKIAIKVVDIFGNDTMTIIEAKEMKK